LQELICQLVPCPFDMFPDRGRYISQS
jgi:hypothetical protein